MATVKAERLPEAIEAFMLILRVAPKARGPRQKRARLIVDQGLEVLKAFSQREQTESGVALFNHLLGVALGIGAIKESQCSRLMLMLIDNIPTLKEAR